jgi:pimeloyl-ACP methyl ester carboxylesterase
MVGKLARLGLIALGFALLASCSTVRVFEVRPEGTAQALRNVLGERPKGEPDAPLRYASDDTPPTPAASPALLQALARFEDACRRELWSRDEVLHVYAESMAFASETIVNAPPGDLARASGADQKLALSLYNRALERFLRATSGRAFRPDDAWRARLEERGIHVTVRRDGTLWPSGRFDELRFAGDYLVRGIDHYYGSDGIGVPLIAICKPSNEELDHREGPDRFYPFWEVYPVTAVLRFDNTGPGRLSAALELHDTLRFNDVNLDGRVVPLAADLTTPTAYHFARGKLSRYERISLFSPEKLTREAGLHMLHPYERGKIPVVLIHGLGSSARAWGKVVNELRGDPSLRERFQFWIYMYPTGNPFALSAADFRRLVYEARQTVDPDASDAAFDQMVLIGHSMGGLISRLAIIDSGDEMWRIIASQPFDQLNAQPEHREMLSRIFFFQPLPFVRRVVFIATPHRGSKLGDQFLGRLVDRLILIPSPLEKAHDAMVPQNPPGFFTPMFLAGVPSSIDELRADNPYLTTMERRPIAARVTAHSIVGRIGLGPLEKSSDGVVPYSSSHVDWVASERVIPASHFCQDDPETIKELRRLLYLHLSELAPQTATVPAASPAAVRP